MYEYGDLVIVYDELSKFTGMYGTVLQVKGSVVTVELSTDRVEYFNRSSLRLVKRLPKLVKA